jgi:hypothetical protein
LGNAHFLKVYKLAFNNKLKNKKIPVKTVSKELGCEGKVEEAQGVMELCDQLRDERRQLEEVYIIF